MNFLTGKLAAQLERKVEMELKRLHRRKTIVSDELSTDNQPTISTPINSQTNSNAKDQPLFTLKQVSWACRDTFKHCILVAVRQV